MTISFSCLETAYEVFIIVEVMIKQLNVNLSETMGTTCSKRVKTKLDKYIFFHRESNLLVPLRKEPILPYGVKVARRALTPRQSGFES